MASLINKLTTYSKFISSNKIKIDSKIIGTKIKPYTYHVDYRQISNYSASILDENEVYFNTEKNDEIIAHPLFAVRISWQIIEKLNQLCEVELSDNLLKNLVHQSEYLEIHRSLRPNDELVIHGEFVSLLPHKLGVKIIIKFEYFDKQERLLITEYIGALIYGAKCSDKGKTSPGVPATRRIEQNSPLWEEKIPVTGLAPYIYDGCNDIVYPIHTDRKYARSIGLPDIILQGTATLAISTSLLIRKEMNNNPNKISIVSGKFTDIVVPPNQLFVRLLEKNQQDLYFDVKEQSGKYVIKSGYIKAMKI
jgi:hypothetical protein